MQRRYFPARRSDSILLYSFALVLALSLAFNAFLLYKQSHQRTIYEFDSVNPAHSVGYETQQRPLSNHKQASQPKDSSTSGPVHRRSD